MSKASNNKTVFQLCKKLPTGYQNQDGSFKEFPAMHVLAPTYTIYGDAKNAGDYRHIRSAKSPIVQTQGTIEYNFERDQLVFTNGLMAIDEAKSNCTMEWCRNHPRNWDNLPEEEKDNALFKEVRPEKEGNDILKDDQIETEAKSLVYALRSEGKNILGGVC